MRSKNKKKKNIENKNIVRNSKHKIILIVLCGLLLISSSILLYFCIRYTNLRENNNDIRNNISKIQEETLNIDNNFITYTDELNNKKDELKDKIKEYNVWLEMIEKVK